MEFSDQVLFLHSL